MDNLYMYGPVDGPLTEDLPLTTHGKKPAVRAALSRFDKRVAPRAGNAYYPPVRPLERGLSEGDISMRVKLLGVLMAVCVLGAAVPASAHHAFSVEFDADKCMDLRGTLVGLLWENPHAYIDVEVTDADGAATTWHLEMVTPNALKRSGTPRLVWESNFGKTINVRACEAYSGGNRGAASYLALSDGLIRPVGQGVERRPDEDKHFNY